MTLISLRQVHIVVQFSRVPHPLTSVHPMKTVLHVSTLRTLERSSDGDNEERIQRSSGTSTPVVNELPWLTPVTRASFTDWRKA